MGDTQSAQREDKQDAAVEQQQQQQPEEEEERENVDDALTEQVVEAKNSKNGGAINVAADHSLVDVNGHGEDEIVSQVIVLSEEDNSEPEKQFQEKQNKVEANDKEQLEIIDMNVKRNDINKGFQKFFSNIGLKVTVKKGSSEPEETAEKPNLPGDIEATEKSIKNDAEENCESTFLSLQDTKPEDVIEKAEKMAMASMEEVECENTDAEIILLLENQQHGITAEKEQDPTCPVSLEDEMVRSPIKRFFSTGIFSGLRKKKKLAEDDTEREDQEAKDKKEALEIAEPRVQDQEPDLEAISSAEVETQKIVEMATTGIADEKHMSLETDMSNLQENEKVQASPLKMLLAGSSLKRKTQRSRSSSDARSSDSREHISDQIPPPQPIENQKDTVITTDAPKEEESAWASFIKLLTPKKRVKKLSITNEESQVPCAEEEVKQVERAQLSDHSTEEGRKRKDSLVSWEAVLCGSGRRRSRKTSDSEDDTLHADNGSKNCTLERNKRAESPYDSEPGSAWNSLKRMVTPKRKSKDEQEPLKGNTQSDNEPQQDDDSDSIKKLPGHKKSKSDESQSVISSHEANKDAPSDDEDSETPAVVPLSEFDIQETDIQAEPNVESQSAVDKNEQLQEDLNLEQAPTAPLLMPKEPVGAEDPDEISESISEHHLLSDIPEEGITTETMGISVPALEKVTTDETIAEETLEITSEAITAPEPSTDITLDDDTEMISAVSQLTSQSSKTSGNTTPVQGKYDILETDKVLLQVVETISSSSQTDPLVPMEVIPQNTTSSLLQEPCKAIEEKRQNVLELHERSDATAFKTGLTVDEIESITELAAESKRECVSEINGFIQTEVVHGVASDRLDNAILSVDEIQEVSVQKSKEINELEKTETRNSLGESLSKTQALKDVSPQEDAILVDTCTQDTVPQEKTKSITSEEECNATTVKGENEQVRITEKTTAEVKEKTPLIVEKMNKLLEPEVFTEESVDSIVSQVTSVTPLEEKLTNDIILDEEFSDETANGGEKEAAEVVETMKSTSQKILAKADLEEGEDVESPQDMSKCSQLTETVSDESKEESNVITEVNLQPTSVTEIEEIQAVQGLQDIETVHSQSNDKDVTSSINLKEEKDDSEIAEDSNKIQESNIPQVDPKVPSLDYEKNATNSSENVTGPKPEMVKELPDSATLLSHVALEQEDASKPVQEAEVLYFEQKPLASEETSPQLPVEVVTSESSQLDVAKLEEDTNKIDVKTTDVLGIKDDEEDIVKAKTAFPETSLETATEKHKGTVVSEYQLEQEAEVLQIEKKVQEVVLKPSPEPETVTEEPEGTVLSDINFEHEENHKTDQGTEDVGSSETSTQKTLFEGETIKTLDEIQDVLEDLIQAQVSVPGIGPRPETAKDEPEGEVLPDAHLEQKDSSKSIQEAGLSDVEHEAGQSPEGPQFLEDVTPEHSQINAAKTEETPLEGGKDAMLTKAFSVAPEIKDIEKEHIVQVQRIVAEASQKTETATEESETAVFSDIHLDIKNAPEAVLEAEVLHVENAPKECQEAISPQLLKKVKLEDSPLAEAEPKETPLEEENNKKVDEIREIKYVEGEIAQVQAAVPEYNPELETVAEKPEETILLDIDLKPEYAYETVKKAEDLQAKNESTAGPVATSIQLLEEIKPESSHFGEEKPKEENNTILHEHFQEAEVLHVTHEEELSPVVSSLQLPEVFVPESSHLVNSKLLNEDKNNINAETSEGPSMKDDEEDIVKTQPAVPETCPETETVLTDNQQQEEDSKIIQEAEVLNVHQRDEASSQAYNLQLLEVATPKDFHLVEAKPEETPLLMTDNQLEEDEDSKIVQQAENKDAPSSEVASTQLIEEVVIPKSSHSMEERVDELQLEKETNAITSETSKVPVIEDDGEDIVKVQTPVTETSPEQDTVPEEAERTVLSDNQLKQEENFEIAQRTDVLHIQQKDAASSEVDGPQSIEVVTPESSHLAEAKPEETLLEKETNKIPVERSEVPDIKNDEEDIVKSKTFLPQTSPELETVTEKPEVTVHSDIHLEHEGVSKIVQEEKVLHEEHEAIMCAGATSPKLLKDIVKPEGAQLVEAKPEETQLEETKTIHAETSEVHDMKDDEEEIVTAQTVVPETSAELKATMVEGEPNQILIETTVGLEDGKEDVEAVAVTRKQEIAKEESEGTVACDIHLEQEEDSKTVQEAEVLPIEHKDAASLEAASLEAFKEVVAPERTHLVAAKPEETQLEEESKTIHAETSDLHDMKDDGEDIVTAQTETSHELEATVLSNNQLEQVKNSQTVQEAEVLHILQMDAASSEVGSPDLIEEVVTPASSHLAEAKPEETPLEKEANTIPVETSEVPDMENDEEDIVRHQTVLIETITELETVTEKPQETVLSDVHLEQEDISKTLEETQVFVEEHEAVVCTLTTQLLKEVEKQDSSQLVETEPVEALSEAETNQTLNGHFNVEPKMEEIKEDITEVQVAVLKSSPEPETAAEEPEGTVLSDINLEHEEDFKTVQETRDDASSEEASLQLNEEVTPKGSDLVGAKSEETLLQEETNISLKTSDTEVADNKDDDLVKAQTVVPGTSPEPETATEKPVVTVLSDTKLEQEDVKKVQEAEVLHDKHEDAASPVATTPQLLEEIVKPEGHQLVEGKSEEIPFEMEANKTLNETSEVLHFMVIPEMEDVKEDSLHMQEAVAETVTEEPEETVIHEIHLKEEDYSKTVEEAEVLCVQNKDVSSSEEASPRLVEDVVTPKSKEKPLEEESNTIPVETSGVPDMKDAQEDIVKVQTAVVATSPELETVTEDPEVTVLSDSQSVEEEDSKTAQEVPVIEDDREDIVKTQTPVPDTSPREDTVTEEAERTVLSDNQLKQEENSEIVQRTGALHIQQKDAASSPIEVVTPGSSQLAEAKPVETPLEKETNTKPSETSEAPDKKDYKEDIVKPQTVLTETISELEPVTEKAEVRVVSDIHLEQDDTSKIVQEVEVLHEKHEDAVCPVAGPQLLKEVEKPEGSQMVEANPEEILFEGATDQILDETSEVLQINLVNVHSETLEGTDVKKEEVDFVKAQAVAPKTSPELETVTEKTEGTVVSDIHLAQEDASKSVQEAEVLHDKLITAAISDPASQTLLKEVLPPKMTHLAEAKPEEPQLEAETRTTADETTAVSRYKGITEKRDVEASIVQGQEVIECVKKEGSGKPEKVDNESVNCLSSNIEQTEPENSMTKNEEVFHSLTALCVPSINIESNQVIKTPFHEEITSPDPNKAKLREEQWQVTAAASQLTDKQEKEGHLTDVETQRGDVSDEPQQEVQQVQEREAEMSSIEIKTTAYSNEPEQTADMSVEQVGREQEKVCLHDAIVTQVILCEIKERSLTLPDVLTEETSKINEPMAEIKSPEQEFKEQMETTVPLIKENVAEESAKETGVVTMVGAPLVKGDDDHTIQVDILNTELKSAEAEVDSVLTVGATDSKKIIDVCCNTLVDCASTNVETEVETGVQEKEATVEEVIQDALEDEGGVLVKLDVKRLSKSAESEQSECEYDTAGEESVDESVPPTGYATKEPLSTEVEPESHSEEISKSPLYHSEATAAFEREKCEHGINEEACNLTCEASKAVEDEEPGNTMQNIQLGQPKEPECPSPPTVLTSTLEQTDRNDAEVMAEEPEPHDLSAPSDVSTKKSEVGEEEEDQPEPADSATSDIKATKISETDSTVKLQVPPFADRAKRDGPTEQTEEEPDQDEWTDAEEVISAREETDVLFCDVEETLEPPAAREHDDKATTEPDAEALTDSETNEEVFKVEMGETSRVCEGDSESEDFAAALEDLEKETPSDALTERD